ncbi:hypothetical protein BDV40DRAFT_265287 [Aspergillus tamarii]|uniref:Uncharacterized protein n=1 Tax=Aspergillus tamarii TaxID=41984 RepID=A0A5N6UWY3_ASPTM|nr:hypothetical protein BDV40DRAFT_265287 [Aspergillus tamarii]
MKFSTLLAATTALLTGVNAIPRLMEVETPEICWRVCFPEKPHCPNGWHAKEFGHCYTCCKEHGGSAADKLDMFWEA